MLVDWWAGIVTSGKVANGSTFKDEEGENWPSLEAARAHAAKIASEVWQAGSYEGYAVSVADLVAA